MKKGALVSGAAAFGLSGAGTAGASAGVQDEEFKALVFRDDFRPFADFTFVSGVIEWAPNWADVRDSAWSDYNTFQIRWLDNGEINPLFVTHEATQELGQYDQDLGFIPDADDDSNQPQVWEMNKEFTPFGDNEVVMEVSFSSLPEDEEDDLLEDEDWWRNDGN